SYQGTTDAEKGDLRRRGDPGGINLISRPTHTIYRSPDATTKPAMSAARREPFAL
ncbi:hypothetical protein B296_00025395, partial [Ensete ventricosum]